MAETLVGCGSPRTLACPKEANRAETLGARRVLIPCESSKVGEAPAVFVVGTRPVGKLPTLLKHQCTDGTNRPRKVSYTNFRRGSRR